MLNAATPATPGSLAATALPGSAAPEADAGPAFALALGQAGSEANAEDPAAPDRKSVV